MFASASVAAAAAALFWGSFLGTPDPTEPIPTNLTIAATETQHCAPGTATWLPGTLQLDHANPTQTGAPPLNEATPRPDDCALV